VARTAEEVQQAPVGGPRPGTKYSALPDMIEDVFPGLCKMQGAIGDRESDGRE
jgi:hypothetical protein